MYIRFEEKEITAKFDEEIKLLTQKSETMGITEQILDMARQEGEALGLRKGRADGRKEEKTEFVKNLLQHTSHSIEDIARLANVSEKFILGISNGAKL